MAITYVCSSCKISSATGTTAKRILVPKPTNPVSFQNADVLVAVVGRGDDPAVTGPTGWTQAIQQAGTTQDDRNISIWYKVITNAAGEPATYNWNSSTAGTFTVGIAALRGVDNTTPFGITGSTTGTSMTSPPCPSIIPPNSNSFMFACAVLGNTAVNIFTKPVNTTSVWTLPVAGANTMCSYFTQPLASGTGIKTWVTTGGDSGADGIAVQISFNPSTAIVVTTPSTHTYFKTPLLKSGRLFWTRNSGQFNIASGMCASSNKSNKWRWALVSSSSTRFYPSGITKWIWVSGSYRGTNLAGGGK
jgi:hypothetical protein